LCDLSAPSSTEEDQKYTIKHTKVNTIYAATGNVGTNMFSVPGALLYLYNFNRPLSKNSCISQGQECGNAFIT
jgi:hypothetical protein